MYCAGHGAVSKRVFDERLEVSGGRASERDEPAEFGGGHAGFGSVTALHGWTIDGMRRRWLTYFLAWTGAGLFYISQDFLTRLARNEAIPWANVLIGWMSAMYICAAFTPAILWVGQRWPLDRPWHWRPVAVHIAASVVFSLISTAMEVPLLPRLGLLPVFHGSGWFLKGFWALLPYDLHGGMLRYWAVVGVQAFLRSSGEVRRREREALELKVQLTAAQLGALKAQLQPHFLFNTLGAIMVLVQQRKTHQAEAMLSRLSDLLRHTLEDVEAQEVPLWRELQFLRLYLSIEQVRFEDRLKVRIDAGPEVSDALVPHMALQPIVENAVRHGMGQSEEPVLIEVAVARGNSHLTLMVTDDGPGCSDGAFEGTGIGLSNTRARLNRIYGDGASFKAENRAPRGVRVTMQVPYRTGEEDR